jgi:hypothetical protein
MAVNDDEIRYEVYPPAGSGTLYAVIAIHRASKIYAAAAAEDEDEAKATAAKRLRLLAPPKTPD